MSTRSKGLESYEIIDLVGEGCIGTVHRAIDRESGRVVALKILRGDSIVKQARRFFVNEARILSRLDHPNIPAFYDVIAGGPYTIVFEWIDGWDLEDVLATRQGFLPEREVIGWAVQICDALAYLHTHPVHPIAFRDLKASHIMVNRAGKAWLVDFNLAHPLPLGGRLEGADRVGTEGFAAPEQYEGTALPASDLYGLGATLHYVLTRIDPRRERPFTFAPPRSVNPAISKKLAAVVMRALAYEIEDRFQDARAMKKALVACL
jgi:eukaryotic-like serine/threonine-protein kinase